MNLCHPTKCGPVTFLASLGGLDTASSFIPRRESRIWLTVGAVTEVWPFLKLQSLVVLGGKWLPFSLVGGIPMFVKELPLVAYKWTPLRHDKEGAMSDQVVYIISCQGFCTHKMNDRIWSFNSWPLILCWWLLKWVTEVILCLKLTFRQMAWWRGQPEEQQTGGRQKKTVLPTTHWHGPLFRGCLQAISILTIV